MSKDDYRRALDAAVREYERLITEQATLEARLSQLRLPIAALTKLCGYEPTVPPGLTDACRLVLRKAFDPLTPVDVRDRLDRRLVYRHGRGRRRGHRRDLEPGRGEPAARTRTSEAGIRVRAAAAAESREAVPVS